MSTSKDDTTNKESAYSDNPGEDFAVKSGGVSSSGSAAESKPEASAYSDNPGEDFAAKSGEDYSPEAAESEHEGSGTVDDKSTASGNQGGAAA